MKFVALKPVLAAAGHWRGLAGLAVGLCTALMPAATQNAVANGETRTLSLVHAHTHETITATFMVDGQYDQSVLDKLNWFLRDWRRDEPTHMDPRLFDTVWQVYRESGSRQPIMVMSAYRSPETNAMLRRRSRQVAEHSQHILGRAMDQHYMDVPMSRIRELGMRLQRGGVGFYPTAGTPFVHLDVGGVRSWPRMSYDQLARLFPDGKTVHLPSNGQPLPGYEAARAELAARGDGSYPTVAQIKSKGFFAWLFGGGSDEEDDDAQAGVRSRPSPRGAPAGRTAVASVSSASVVNTALPNERGSASYPAPAPPPAPFAQAAPPPAPAPQPVPVAPAPAPVAPVQAVPPTAVALAVPPAEPAATPEPAPVRSPPVPDIATGPAIGLPLPPRRPTELALVEPAAPLPPTRPAALAAVAPHDAGPGPRKADAIGSLIGAGPALPDVITRGAAGGVRAPRALGYAALGVLPEAGRPAEAAAVPLPVARPAMLPPRLDRSNFRALTGPESSTRNGGRSALGAAMPPLRAATKGDLGALEPAPATQGRSFQARASDLSSTSFTGPVLKPSRTAAGTTARNAVE